MMNRKCGHISVRKSFFSKVLILIHDTRYKMHWRSNDTVCHTFVNSILCFRKYHIWFILTVETNSTQAIYTCKFLIKLSELSNVQCSDAAQSYENMANNTQN